MMQADLRCYFHPHREATSQCDRCGDMLCRLCLREHEGEFLCKNCLKIQISGGPGTYINRWSLIVAGLYALILGLLAWPVAGLAFIDESLDEIERLVSFELPLTGVVKAFFAPPIWIYAGAMALCQVALLVVPVRVASRRPVSRRTLIMPIVVSGLLMGGLVAAGVFSIAEFVQREFLGERSAVVAVSAGLAMWVFWSVLFYGLGKRREPGSVIKRQCRCLFRGSVLELLVAVPTHIVARHRGYCCAGVATFVGLTFGLSVMLFAFGPSVFFLFMARWRRLHPKGEQDRIDAEA